VLPPAGVCGRDVGIPPPGKLDCMQFGLKWFQISWKPLARDSRQSKEACRSQGSGSGPKGRHMWPGWAWWSGPKCRLVSRSRTLNRGKLVWCPTQTHIYDTWGSEEGVQGANVNSSRGESEIKASSWAGHPLSTAQRTPPTATHRQPQSSESADWSLVAVILQVKCHSIDLRDSVCCCFASKHSKHTKKYFH